MRITIIDRYLFRRMVANLARAVLALVVIYILIDLFTHRSASIQKHEVPWPIAVQYYLALTPGILVKYAAPFALLISALLVLGDTAQNNETVAALAGGISLHRFTRMPILVALGFAALVFLLQETVGVEAARKVRYIENNYFSRNPDTERRPVSWKGLEGGWTCHIMKFNRVALTGERVFLYAFRPDIHYQIEAKRIFWDPDRNQWLLERGWWQEYDPISGDRIQNRRITQQPAPFSESPTELFSLEQPPETKSLAEIRRNLRYARDHEMAIHPLLVKLHVRYAQPTLSFVMIWLAIPFAMRLRRGGLAISFGASIAIAITYLLAFFIAAGLGHMGRINPVLAAWLPNALFLLAGIALFSRTPT